MILRVNIYIYIYIYIYIGKIGTVHKRTTQVADAIIMRDHPPALKFRGPPQ